MSNTLVAECDSVLTEARQIVDTARTAARDLTAAETKHLNTLVTKVKELGEQITLADSGAAALKALFGGNGGNTDGRGYLDLELSGRRRLADQITAKMGGTYARYGSKALITSGTAVSSIALLPTDPIAEGKVPQSLLSVIPSVQIPAGGVAAYMQQTGGRSGGAEAVSPGDLKPTTDLTLVRKTVALEVVATLSSPVNRFDLEDSTTLAQFVQSELVYSVSTALEGEILVGTGTSPHLSSLTASSGIQVIAATAGDLLATLRKSITAMESIGYGDDLVFVLSPATWETAELLRNESGAFDLTGGPVDRAAQKVWGVPVVISLQVPTGKAVIFNRSSAALYVDQQGLRTDWGTPGATFSQNQLVCRSELRAQLALYQPAAVGLITLPA